MDNLRGYGEDDTSSSSCLGPSSKELPSPSAGTAPPLGTQAAVMAGTPSSVVPVTSGPVPLVSAQSGSSLPGSQDCMTPSSGNQDDLLPPPPPAEPYKDFLAHVGRDLYHSYTCTTYYSCSSRLWNALSYTTPHPTPALSFFSGATPPFVQPTGNPVPPSALGLASVAPTVTQPDAVNPSQGSSPYMIKTWKEDFMREMKSSWEQFVGDAPPQPTVGPSVPAANMGPDGLRQLSPSDDRKALRAQRKAGSKRADSGVHQSSRSSERSSADRHWDRVRHRRVSPDSSFPTRRLSSPAKRSRLGSHHAPRGSSSSEGRERSLRAPLPRRSRSPLPRHRVPSPSSSSHHRRSRDSPAPSRWPLEAGRTRRLAGQPSLSPRRRSPASHRRSRRSSWGRQSSPPLRTRAPNRHSSLSSSRSPSPRGRRSCSMS